MKSMIKQVVPPILVPIGRTLLGRNRPIPEEPEMAALRKEHERRNEHAAGDEIVLRDHLKFKLHPESREAFEFFCFRSPDMVIEMNGFLELTRDRQRLLDVGALHGLFSLAFAAQSPTKKALAVDASPLAFSRLLYNIYKNQFHNITPIECAVSDASGTLTMHYEWEHAVAAEVCDADQTTLSVEKRTGDDLCAAYAFEPDTLKIDVEGHEVKVLKGLRQTLKKARPLIFLELHPGRIAQERDDIGELAQLLADCGYQASLIDQKPVTSAEIAAFATDQRLILTPH